MQRLFLPIILIVSWSLLSLDLLGQNKVDSLKAQLDTATIEIKVDLLNQISIIYRNDSLEKASFYASEALELAEDLRDEHRIAQSFINLGIVRRNMGQSDLALDHFSEALKLAKSIRNLLLQADALHKMGVTHLLAKSFENSIKYAEEELTIWKELQNDRGVASAYNMLGLNFLNLKRYEESKEALEESLSVAKKINNQYEIYKPLVNLGDLYLRQEQPEKALIFILQSQIISKKIGNNYGIAVSNLKMGNAYLLQGKDKKAIDATLEALETAKQLKLLSLERNCYKLLSEIYESKKDFKNALKFNQDYVLLEDAIIRDLTKQQTSKIQSQLELERKSRELEDFRQETEYNQLKFMTIGTLLLFTLTLVFVISNRQQMKRASAKVLAQKNQEIEKQDRELEERRIMLETQNDLLDKRQQKITESLDYTRQVQASLLPENPSFLNLFSNHYLFNSPKNEISGDFCWYTHKADSIYAVIADCSGHGVSGAFNTVIINSLTAQIINETQYRTPADIMREIHRRVLKMIPTDQYIDYNVGIKIAVIKINAINKKMVFSSAKTPIYYVTNNVLKVLPSDRVYVGGSQYEDIESRFNNRTVSLKKGDRVFVFTDGYQDQFGGIENTKFLVKNLRKVLHDTASLPFKSQSKLLENNFNHWKGEHEQTDDVLFFGMQV